VSKRDKVRLGDVCDVRDGTHESPEYVFSGYPLITSKNVTKGFIDIDNVNYISEEDYKKINLRSYVSDGDIIMPMIGTIGNPIIVNKTFDFAIKNVALIKFSNSNVLNKYIFYIFKSNIFTKYSHKENRGGTQKFISLNNIRNFIIPLPPIEIQTQIAHILDTITNIISLRKKQLLELDNLIKSVFYDMFGDPVRNEKGWEIKKLKDITSKIGSGATPLGGERNYQEEGISLIRSMNVHNNLFLFENLAHISDSQASLLDNVIVNEDDILLNITGASVARSCIVPVNVLPARVNQHVSIIRLMSDNANNIYINNVLTNLSFQKILLNLANSNGATREALTKKQIEELILPIPPLLHQKQFATIVDKIEDQKIIAKKGLEESQHLFDSLMSQYFN